MNIATTIIGLAIVALCLLPIFLISQNNARKRRNLQNKIEEEAKQMGYAITQTDTWNSSIIGIDEKNKVVFMLEKNSNAPVTINLSNVEQCRLNKIQRSIKDSNNGQIVTDYVALNFIFRNSENTDAVVDFYNINEGNGSPYDQIQLAEKWQKIIAPLLDKRK